MVTNGFQASHSNEALEQTEYLKLVHRYLSQAREIEKLAGDGKVIEIANCDSANVADLLRVLGFRMRGGCGSEVVLETVNATRAFLTTDSGFPLPALEEALRTNRPFKYDYHPARVPVIFGPDYWLSPKEKETSGFLDVLLSDPAVCRLYLGISKLDRETAEAFHKDIPLAHLKAYAHVLDFFGGMFEMREGKAVVPGAPRTVAAWTELVGVPPDQGAAFFEKLIAKDDGWLASYYDALARINGPVQDYLTEPARMKRFYNAIRGKVTSPGPARPVFRANADMMLLTTRLWIEPDGQPHIPGNLQVWKDLFATHPQGKYDAKLTRAAAAWKEPDDVLEALFGLTRKAVENEPLKIFMALSDLDRYRAKPLAPATVDSLARNYHIYGSQYAIFNECRHAERQVHPAVPGYRRAGIAPQGSAAAHRRARYHAGAGGPMADLLPLGKFAGRQSGRDVRRAARAVPSRARRPRAIRCGPGGRHTAASPPPDRKRDPRGKGAYSICWPVPPTRAMSNRTPKWSRR